MYRNSHLCLVAGIVFLILALHRVYGVVMLFLTGAEGFYIFRHMVHAATWAMMSDWFIEAYIISGVMNANHRNKINQFCLPDMKVYSYIAGALCLATALMIFTQVFVIDKADGASYVVSVVLELASWLAISAFFFLWGRRS